MVLEKKAYMFNFNSMECIDQCETHDNPFGAVAVSENDMSTVVVTPHSEVGMLRVIVYEDANIKNNPIRVHDKAVRALAVNPDCSLLASASEYGTVIRISSIETGEELQELR